MSAAQNSDSIFLKQIVLVIVAAAGLAAYPIMEYASHDITVGVITGAALGVVNVLMGYGVVRFSAGKAYHQFTQIVLGGIVIRLFVMVGLLLIAVGLFKVHAVSLISALFVMYIIFLAVEVLHIHKHIQHS